MNANKSLLKINTLSLTRLDKDKRLIRRGMRDLKILPGIKKLLKKAIQYYKNNKYDEAIKLWEEILETDKNNYIAMVYLAHYYMDIKKYEKAIKYYSESIKIENDKWGIFLNVCDRARCFYALGRYGEACKDYNRAIKIIPEASNLWRDTAVCYCNNAEFEKAFEYIDKAISLGGNVLFYEPYLCKAEIYSAAYYSSIYTQDGFSTNSDLKLLSTLKISENFKKISQCLELYKQAYEKIIEFPKSPFFKENLNTFTEALNDVNTKIITLSKLLENQKKICEEGGESKMNLQQELQSYSQNALSAVKQAAKKIKLQYDRQILAQLEELLKKIVDGQYTEEMLSKLKEIYYAPSPELDSNGSVLEIDVSIGSEPKMLSYFLGQLVTKWDELRMNPN